MGKMKVNSIFLRENSLLLLNRMCNQGRLLMDSQSHCGLHLTAHPLALSPGAFRGSVSGGEMPLGSVCGIFHTKEWRGPEITWPNCLYPFPRAFTLPGTGTPLQCFLTSYKQILCTRTMRFCLCTSEFAHPLSYIPTYYNHFISAIC